MGKARRKVAILGGGVGAMTAAFALTSDPDWREKLEITVYQVGWRLGGKGASGRKATAGERIEEHGLHVWSGFYDNAIKQMRACLDELRDAKIDGVYSSFETAFTPHNNIALGAHSGSDWTLLPMRPENNQARPGDGGVFLSPWAYFRELLAGIRHLLEMLAQKEGLAEPDTAGHRLYDHAESLPEDPNDHTPQHREKLTELARDLETEVHALQSVGPTLAPENAMALLAIDALHLGSAVVRGILADDVYLKGFDWIDDIEISDWLKNHGAEQHTIDGPLVRAVYDYAFGFRNGICDPEHRAIGAGTFIKGSIRLFLTYKGSIFFKMRAGMGDTIFTPYYKALERRGVTFKFFHKVKALRLDPTGTSIAQIEIDRQATPKPGYRILRRVGDLDCWPSEPDFDHLKEGKALVERGIDLESSWTDWEPVEELKLRKGQDFDDVVLGISLGALPHMAADLIAADPAWQNMVEKVQTVATQAMQLWMKPKLDKLGWKHGNTILTAYADEMNTWADMTHVEDTENWPPENKPGSIAYFCGPLPDPETIPPFTDTGFPARAKAEVRAKSWAWMHENGAKLWPNAFKTSGDFDLDQLIVSRNDKETDAWEAQYFRANFEPTERYVLSVPGSTTARLRADRSGFDGLWLAGDWTYTGVNAGCVEAAAMSGLRAAAGLMGVKPNIVGEEDDPIIGGIGDDFNAKVPKAPVLRSIRAQNSPWPWSSVFGMAQTTGATVMLPFPKADVQAMLPDGLTLAEQSVTDRETHPVILLFARQRDVRPNLVPFGMNYSEFICAVPWVVHTDPALADLPPMICPTKLYLDSMPPILLGIYGYGFPKVRAAMQVEMDRYIIRSAQDDREIISARYTRGGPKQRAAQLPNFEKIRAAYEMAMVTRNKIGQWQYSVYDFSLGQAEFEPLDIEVRISSEALGLPRGVYEAKSLAETPLGGFFLTADATINNPLQSHQLRDILRKAN